MTDNYTTRVLDSAHKMATGTPIDVRIARRMVEKYKDIQSAVVTLIVLDTLTEYKNDPEIKGDCTHERY